ncbi:hypothetical protein P3S67_029851 [Capsicum chacoense]
MINVNNEVVSSSNNASDFSLKEGLQCLRYLVLTGVDISKSLKSFHWEKPISSLSNLMSLQLSNCNISGRIPIVQLLNLTSVSTLAMSSNVLTSSIHDFLSNLTTLSVLDFSGNDLNVPWSKLISLDISFTRVGGTVPPSLSNSTSITVFLDDGCLIEGSIPPSITKLKKLRLLMLNDNDITGQLPVSMSSLTRLQYLSLFQNKLQGNIPISICQILSPKYLNLNWNNLTERLPSCILQLPKLSYFYVQKNNLNVDTPLSLFQKSRLDQISFGISGLSVEIDDQDQYFVQIF